MSDVREILSSLVKSLTPEIQAVVADTMRKSREARLAVEMTKLETLIGLCKASVIISVNAHRDVYETVEEYVGDQRKQEGFDELSPEVLDRMMATDTIIELQFYPKSPVAFYRVVGADLDEVVTKALNLVRPKEDK